MMSRLPDEHLNKFRQIFLDLKIWTPEKIAVINLKFEQGGFTTE